MAGPRPDRLPALPRQPRRQSQDPRGPLGPLEQGRLSSSGKILVKLTKGSRKKILHLMVGLLRGGGEGHAIKEK